MTAEFPAGDVLLPFRVKKAEPASALFHAYTVFLCQSIFEFFQRAGISGNFGNCIPQELLLCLVSCCPRSHAICNDLLIELVQFFLFPSVLPILTFCNLYRSGREQIYLMQMFPFGDLHDSPLHGSQVISRLMMLITGAAVAWPLHKILRFNIQFSDAVDYDMDVNIAGTVVSIHVSADQSLMPRKETFCKFQPNGLCPFAG